MPIPTHAAFLRAVNLGARRRVSSADLRAAFEELSFDEVQTFRTSGNVVFAATGRDQAKLRSRIEGALADRFGFPVPVYLRSAQELRGLAARSEDLRHGAKGRSGKLQVALLERAPAARERRQVLAHTTDEDALAFAERELLWLPSGGTQRSSLDLRAIEKLIGPWTMRTMETIAQIASRYFA